MLALSKKLCMFAIKIMLSIWLDEGFVKVARMMKTVIIEIEPIQKFTENIFSPITLMCINAYTDTLCNKW